jgi:hypothetical protein
MSKYVSIDPGKHACSIACWQDCQLVYAGLIENPFKYASRQRADRWGDLGRNVARIIRIYLGEFDSISLIVEVPQIYPGPRKEDPNDLIDLAGVLGAIIGASEAHVVWSPLPKDWKGQLPKEVTKLRVDQKLTGPEKERIAWPLERLRHNVYDAVHLGIVYLERQGLRDFTKK